MRDSRHGRRGHVPGRYVLLAMLGLALVLAACGGAEPTQAPAPDGVPDSAPDGAANADPTFDPASCPRAALEQWLQRSSSLVFEFALVINQNLATPPDRLGATLDQLTTLRSALPDLAAPDCAADHVHMIAGMMDGAIRALSGYVSSGSIDLVAFATGLNAEMDQIRAMEAQLGALYGSLPR
jgi:hypothetical protein